MASRLGIKGTQYLYRCKKELLIHSGPIPGSLEGRVRESEAELRRSERERDILKKRWLLSATANRGCLRGGGKSFARVLPGV